ncbi:MAG: hypothetical protein H7Y17_05015 [Chlorobia bacterium]|nr:hypothetical protein [Fimbriimonadaceae bacterium]
MLRSLATTALVGLLASGIFGSHQIPTDDKTAIKDPPNPPPAFTVRNRGNASVEVKFDWVQLNDEYDEYFCGVNCQGTHKSPSECEKGDCDTTCERDHTGTFYAEVEEADYSLTRFFEDAGKLTESGKKIGIDNLPSIQVLRTADIEVDEDTVSDAYDLDVDWKHWSTKPCSGQVRIFKWAVYRLKARITPKRYDPGLKTTFTGDTVSVNLSELYIPTGVYEDLKPVSKCLCYDFGPMPMPMPTYKKASYYDGGSEPIDYREGTICLGRDGMEYALPIGTLKDYQFQITVKSMNEIEWSAINYTPMPVDINIYPGVTLKPKDPSYQDIIATTAVKLHLPAAMSGPSAERVSVTGRGMCLNMLKEQPSGSTPYVVTTPNSSEATKLARLYDSESIKTVEGQIRMWILTDKATLPEIQKHLIFPKPSPAQYLHSLHAVATKGDVNLRKPEYAKCLDPNLIGGAPASRAQISWYVELMSKLNPTGLAAAAKNSANFVALWLPTASRYQDQYVCDLANALARSSNPAVAESAAAVLMTVPESHRENVDSLGGLAAVSNWLRRKNVVLADAANRVIEAFHSKSSALTLENVHPELPEATKAKSAEILKSLG